MPKRKRIRYPVILFFMVGLALVGSALIFFFNPASAAGNPVSQRPSGASLPAADNSTCLSCHAKPGLTFTLPSGELLPLSIDGNHFKDSVHAGVLCTDCHTDISAYPHLTLTAQTRRDVSLEFYTTCKQCHLTQYDQTLDSVHQKALAGGNTNAAICTDCHNPHTQQQLTDPSSGQILAEARVWIPTVCARCHSTIYDEYKTSVHGSALVGTGNRDVPTCIDCHGVHNIQNPTTNAFRLDSPQMCAKCHTDTATMSKYGISTQVLNTYVADFHGTTVNLFEKLTPEQATNKPVCFDCHGVHNIQRVDDPVNGLEMKQNLLATCQRCHPDATSNFPDAWMSHYIPSPTHDALVYYVNLFYKIFIPTVIGGMSIFVLSDIVRRILDRCKGVK